MTIRPSIELCWLGVFGQMEHGDKMPDCYGKLVRCHLIPKQKLGREGVDPWDRRSWVWACGGLNGSTGHHGMFDSSRTLRLPRSAIPAMTEQLALEAGLLWWLDKTYGERNQRQPPLPRGGPGDRRAS